MNTLEKELSDLRIYANELDAKLRDDIKATKKKITPKRKVNPPFPQIPQSSTVRAACEPSYTSKLETGSRTSSTYSNLVPVKSFIVRNNPRSRSGDVLLYTNLLPPGGTNHVYSNIPMQQNIAESIYGDRDTRSEISRLSDLGAQSNYSELRRPGSAYPPSSASVNAQDFSTYGGSQTSSTYESLYEPINPRPCSQMSGTSLYSGYVGTRVEPTPEPEKALYCGNCYKCGEKIMGETTGCTAMERIYHIACFCCQECGINLQGRPFYTVQGKALCEKDYLATLEKCSICGDPILDRILRATGKPYHPRCFTCVVCHKSLDGIPFTVDAVNRIHCIEDFHRRYAPRCATCREPIIPEGGKEETVRIVALDKSFHIACYACEDCGMSLCSREEGLCFPLDGHLYCRECNARRIQDLSRNIS
ncbi:lipoma-preferred partner homolog [Amyelois transitella]|uniref:lipoma-preferred partner homolog n=1 Tax=Amyelois transitella TaxID=680683 RepID=UPI00067CCBD7|nr:lipoma-preferred partner homolog [Amyelois transitella]